MEAVTRVHAVLGPLLVAVLVALALVVAVLAWRSVEPPAGDTVRRVLLGIVVVEAALGLTLFVRGAAPAEWIHWLYAALILAVLLAPGAVTLERARDRGLVMAAVAGIAAVLAWRLVGSG